MLQSHEHRQSTFPKHVSFVSNVISTDVSYNGAVCSWITRVALLRIDWLGLKRRHFNDVLRETWNTAYRIVIKDRVARAFLLLIHVIGE